MKSLLHDTFDVKFKSCFSDFFLSGHIDYQKVVYSDANCCYAKLGIKYLLHVEIPVKFFQSCCTVTLQVCLIVLSIPLPGFTSENF